MSDGIARERLVLSEVHVGSSSVDEEAEVVSRYTYLTPASSAHGGTNLDESGESSDSEGDKGEAGDGGGNNVARRRKRPRHAESQRCSRPAHEVLTVVHKMATTLGLVGQQVWSAAFLLGDFVLTHEELFAGAQVLELGAGPGVAGLIAARVARKCYLTDYHYEVLKLLARNVEANSHLFALGNATTARNGEGDTPAGSNASVCGNVSPGHGDIASEQCVAVVRELDWFTFSTEEGPTDAAICDTVEGRNQGDRTQVERNRAVMTGEEIGSMDESANAPFRWSGGELEGLSSSSTRTRDGGLVIIAADVIYDEGLTDALFDVLKSLMPAPRISLPEKANGDTPPTLLRENSSGESNETSVGTTSTTANSTNIIDAAAVSTPCSRKPIKNTGTEGSAFVRGDGEAVLFLAIEKRFNFSLAELSVAATGYSALMRNVLDVTKGGGAAVHGEQACRQKSRDGKAFEGRKLPLSFQQCFRYQRSNAMELWEIRRRPVQQ